VTVDAASPTRRRLPPLSQGRTSSFDSDGGNSNRYRDECNYVGEDQDGDDCSRGGHHGNETGKDDNEDEDPFLDVLRYNVRAVTLRTNEITLQPQCRDTSFHVFDSDDDTTGSSGSDGCTEQQVGRVTVNTNYIEYFDDDSTEYRAESCNDDPIKPLSVSDLRGEEDDKVNDGDSFFDIDENVSDESGHV
jgi:hypothetical protein